MDKRQYDDALKVVEDAGVTDMCLAVLRKLITLRGSNVFGIIDEMQNSVESYALAVEAVKNLREILKLIAESESRVNIIVDAGFARGLEYYTGMIFEVNIPELDLAIGGGGRYDRLIELFGGESTPAVGVAHGIDRIMLALQIQRAKAQILREKTGIIIPIEERLRGEALKVAQRLRSRGIPVEIEVMRRKMAKALEDADRRKMDFAIIIGEKELKEGAVAFRDLKQRTQRTVKIEEITKVAKEITAEQHR